MIDNIKYDGFYSDMFKGVFAKGVASGMNQLCEQGRLVLFSVEGEMLAYYPLKGTEFKAKEIEGKWMVYGTPLDYCRFMRAGTPGTVKIMSWGGEVVCALPATNSNYFDAGMDFDSYITISF